MKIQKNPWYQVHVLDFQKTGRDPDRGKARAAFRKNPDKAFR
jgi:hypothetical protein